MTNLFWQLVVTIWIGAHPVNFTVPKIYPSTDFEACEAAGVALAHRRKPHAPRMEFWCVATDKRKI